MASDTSDRLSLPFLQAGQAQKEITHNEALALIDMLLHPQAESATLTSPPSGAIVGECWIVAAGGTGAWAGHDGEFACLTSGGWRFAAPRAGLRIAVTDDGLTRVHDGSGWTLDPSRPDGFYVAGARVIGSRQAAIASPSGGAVIDVEARNATVQILTILRAHGLISTT